MSYQVERIRKDFPSLNTGLAYFDGPGGTQTPKVVGDAIAKAITEPLMSRRVRLVSLVLETYSGGIEAISISQAISFAAP